MPTAQHAMDARTRLLRFRFCVAIAASAFGSVATLQSDALATLALRHETAKGSSRRRAKSRSCAQPIRREEAISSSMMF